MTIFTNSSNSKCKSTIVSVRASTTSILAMLLFAFLVTPVSAVSSPSSCKSEETSTVKVCHHQLIQARKEALTETFIKEKVSRGREYQEFTKNYMFSFILITGFYILPFL